MRMIAIFTTFFALLLSLLWLINKPGWDSIVATAASVAAFASSFFLIKSNSSPQQNQSVTGGSTGIQAGRDVKAKSIK
jgi:hypothetical protein